MSRQTKKDRLRRANDIKKRINNEVNVDEENNKNETTKEQIMEEVKTEEPKTETPKVEEQKEVKASETFNPFDEEVSVKPYTKDMIKADMGDIENHDQQPIPEPTYDRPVTIEEEETMISSSPKSNDSLSSSNETASSQQQSSPSPPPSPKPSVNPPLEDLSAGQKRKAAKQTAEVILTTYKQFVPIPFVKIASFNKNKLKKLDMKGEISLSMPIMEDGTTVEEYCDGVNKQVEEVFKVTEEMQDALREPLIDVLMEQDMALTPTQRLMIAAGGQIVQFTAQSIQLGMQNRDAMKTFKNFRAENSNYSAPPHQETPVSNQPKPPQEDVKQPPQEEVKETKVDEPNESEQAYEPPVMDIDMETYIKESGKSK